MDDLSTGKRQNVHALEKKSNFEFVNHDLTKPFFPEKVDAIFNLACPASPIHYQKNPINTFKTSVIGSINMLELAKKYNAKIMIDGSLKHQKTEGSIHKVAAKILGAESCNGWTYWHYQSGNSLKPIDKLREKLRPDSH